ncbi:MAG TPA: hypothetical protein VMG82_09455 [Candidatus Sulfotelmatobacter sp.]|nr:hypothetical protein [Candidatus Sulfotelmatobacter sp.]
MRGRSLGYIAGTFVLVALGWILTGEAARPDQQGVPTDWSHRHVVFSQPSTDAQAAAVMYNPRYWQQFNREHFVRTLNTGEVGLSNLGMFANAAAQHTDWSQNLGNGANAGAGVYPAKYSFQITSATCASGATPDYAAFSTGLLGSSSQASIVAFDNLYSGCTGIVPTLYWAFNTGGRILTSPVLSPGGTQVAFVQTTGGIASLVLLKWATGGTVSAPVTLVSVANSAYRSCAAPCMTTIVLRTASNVAVDDTTSSVFPDYTNDTIWVGGTLGWLHTFTGVFRGTPTRVTTGGFPVQVKPANPTALTSPVHDFASNNVYVGDAGGFFYRVSSTGVVTASGQVDFGAGVVDGPIVDATAGKAYVFASSDGTTNCAGARPCAAVYMFGTSFAAGTTGTRAVVGVSQAAPPNPNPLRSGGFDSTYLASANATGNLYVCGNTAGPPTLYQIPINAGAFGTVVTGPALSSATTGCSPVTDISNPNAAGGRTEWIFASAQAGGSGNSCGPGGCIMNFVDTPWQPSHAYTVGQQVLDTRFNVQTCRTAGTSRTVAQGAPAWNVTVGGSTPDAGVRWVNQGPHAAAHGAWQASHAYALGNSIIDSNGNIQVVTTAGTSRTVAQGHPAWQTTIYAPTTADNTVRWRNAGLPATASLAAAGGTGGVIIDNIVGSGTMAGASQVYFSTQGNQVCGSSGTGGCAVQASQSALQ